MSTEPLVLRCLPLLFVACLVLAWPLSGRCDTRFDRYNVHVKLDSPDRNSFQVTSRASGSVQAGSDTIQLDYEGGSVDSLSLVLGGMNMPNPIWRLRNGHLRIRLDSRLARDTPVVVTTSTTARYSRPKGDGLVKYWSKDGVLYSTQFEPAAARKVFPVLDRPDAPAQFHFTIQCRSSCRAFSNAPARSVRHNGTLFEFHDTPTLSPHLAAFVAGDLVRSRTIMAGRHHVRLALVSPMAYQQYAPRVLRLAKQVVEAYEDQGLVLPDSKIDLVLVPEFRYYGMENPGILFFRAELVSWAAHGDHWDDLKQLIAHEFAHQWFGNVLAPSRWRDVWISESFATWATARIVPGTDRRLVDLVDQIRGIGLPVVSSYPQVESAPGSIFASSRYGRGAHVLQAVFGDDVPLGTVLKGLLAGDDRAYLTTPQLLDRLDQSGLSSVDMHMLGRALHQIPPDAVAIALRGHRNAKAPDAPASPCAGTHIPDFDAYPLRIWTYVDGRSYTRVLRCIDQIPERQRLTLDVSAFAATWRGQLSLPAALGVLEAESVTSRSSHADAIRAEVLGYLLQAVPANKRQDVRHIMLERIRSRRAFSPTGALARVLTHPDYSTEPSETAMRNWAEKSVHTNPDKYTAQDLAGAQAEAIRWLVAHPGAWPLGKHDAYQFVSAAVQREDVPLHGITIEQFRRFLELNVNPDRYDNVALKFAGTCDDQSLALLLGTDLFQSSRAIEQRDASARAIYSCLFVRARATGRKLTLR